AGRVLVVSAGAGVVAFVCCLPWSVTFLHGGASWSAFSGAVPGAVIGPADLLRGHAGPIGAFWGSWGLIGAASFALLTGRRERLGWTAIWWLTALSAVALSWAGTEGWLSSGGGATLVLLAPAVPALAASCGVGVSAFERDVASAQLGWRQAAGVLAGACLAVGCLPALAAVLGGRAGLPVQGVDQTLDWTVPAPGHPYNVLWLGDPRALPGNGSQLQRGLSWYVTDSGLPRGTEVWPSASTAAGQPVAKAILAAENGSTVDLGTLLSPAGIRYLVVPTADAPLLPGTQSPTFTGAPPGLVAALQSQGDLLQRPPEGGELVFENASWTARDGAGTKAFLASAGRVSKGSFGSPLWRHVGVSIGLLTWILAIAEGALRRRRRADAATSPAAAWSMGRPGASENWTGRDALPGSEASPELGGDLDGGADHSNGSTRGDGEVPRDGEAFAGGALSSEGEHRMARP
ncbi:MAG: hypothetical protein ACRDZT_00705, partial [Acidimicrobiales bacterium]